MSHLWPVGSCGFQLSQVFVPDTDDDMLVDADDTGAGEAAVQQQQPVKEPREHSSKASDTEEPTDTVMSEM